MKKILLFLSFLLMSIGVWGAKSTLTFTSACSGSGAADDGAVWVITSDGAESTYDGTKGIHYGTDKSSVTYIRLTTSGINGTISQVKVNASTASGVSATVGVTIGGSEFGGSPKSLTTSAANYTFAGSATGEREIVVEITKPSKANKALYCKSIEITYVNDSKYTVKWVANGDTIYKEIDKTYNDKVDSVPILDVSNYCADLFIGWTNVEYYDNSRPFILFNNIEQSPRITDNTIFYSVFANFVK